MARRSAPALRRTQECGVHKLYRTEYEAQVKSAWHLMVPCDRCCRGMVWHIWQHDRHFHVGHQSVRALSA